MWFHVLKMLFKKLHELVEWWCWFARRGSWRLSTGIRSDNAAYTMPQCKLIQKEVSFSEWWCQLRFRAAGVSSSQLDSESILESLMIKFDPTSSDSSEDENNLSSDLKELVREDSQWTGRYMYMCTGIILFRGGGTREFPSLTGYTHGNVQYKSGLPWQHRTLTCTYTCSYSTLYMYLP